MKHFRIGLSGETYFAQMRVWGRWRTLPSWGHYSEHVSIRWYKHYAMAFTTFEAAQKLVEEYRMRLDPNHSAVFTVV